MSVLVDGVGVEDSVGFVFDVRTDNLEAVDVVVEDGVLGAVGIGACYEGIKGSIVGGAWVCDRVGRVNV